MVALSRAASALTHSKSICGRTLYLFALLSSSQSGPKNCSSAAWMGGRLLKQYVTGLQLCCSS